VKIVTISTDTSSQIHKGRGIHGIQATMLADPKLLVSVLLGYRNNNNNNLKTPGRPGMPVPTSLLVDEQGKVVWKDQSTNYTQRSDPDLVGGALREFFPA
jgi:peroxiredoxin